MLDRVSEPSKKTEHEKLKPSKRKRLRRKERKRKINKLNFIGSNADGLFNKFESLENMLRENPAAVFLQETQLHRPGRIKTPNSKNFTWYELHRTVDAEKGEMGGGLALGVANSLNPSWISEGDDNCEALTVEIWVEGFPIRLVCGYGPQNYDKTHRKEKFWEYLDNEVGNAFNNGAGFILQMDGNLWAGKTIIKDDPKDQNQNGRYFEKFLERYPCLTVVNALPLCTGLITKKRNTKTGTQESVLDFYVVCDKILPLITSMTLDEHGQNSLTRYRGNIVRSDHCRLDLKVDLVFHKEKSHEPQLTFNVRNKLGQEKFLEYTTNTNMFTNCFLSDKKLDHKFNTWKSKLQKSLYTCFKRVRVVEADPKLTHIDDLMTDKKDLFKQKNFLSTDDFEDKLDILENKISQECANKEFDKLVKVVGELETGSGGTESTNVWKQFRKAYPKKSKPIPTGVKNINKKVITNPEEKKEITIKHFEHRMRTRPRHHEAKEIGQIQEETLKLCIEDSKRNKSLPFSMIELEKVLKHLKSGKSKDFEGYIPELFKEGVIGNNLKESLLMMFNQMKYEMVIPECLRTAHVTILH